MAHPLGSEAPDVSEELFLLYQLINQSDEKEMGHFQVCKYLSFFEKADIKNIVNLHFNEKSTVKTYA